MLQLDLLQDLILKTKTDNNTRFVRDIVRKKWIQLTPEEHVRQAIIHYFIHKMHYPAGLITVEKQIKYGTLIKRYDIVVYDRNHQPWMLVECKAPEVGVNQHTLHQLLQYQSQILSPYWLLSNGVESYCADARNIMAIKWMDELPGY